MRALWPLLMAVSLWAQSAAPIRWKIAGVSKGPAVKVKLAAEIAEGWHLYSLKKLEGGPIATTITVREGQAFQTAGRIEAPEPVVTHDPNFDMDVEYYTGAPEFAVPVKAAAGAKPGPNPLAVTVRFQACNDRICLPPRTVTLETTID
jgi:hypothetical protein